MEVREITCSHQELFQASIDCLGCVTEYILFYCRGNMKRQPIYLAISLSLLIITLFATGVPTPVEFKVVNSQFWANKQSAQAAPTNAGKPISEVSLNKDGTIMVNGKSFFPLGIYHNSQNSPDWSTTGKRGLNDLQEIAKAGFNTIHPEIGGNYESDVLFLKEALRLGVYVLPNFSYDNRIAIISKYKNNPAILGWDIADDVDHPNNKFTPAKIMKWHRDTKQIDSNRLTYTSGAFLNNIEPFMHTSDIVGFQSYPIDNGTGDKKPLRNSYYTYYSLLTAKLDNNGNPSEPILDKRTIIANLQVFPWKDKPPNAHEVRNMTYSALINGVKGILYFTYFDGKWDLPIHKDLWNGIKSLVPEINTLTPVLLNGALTKIDTKVDDLYAGQWTYNNSVYVVILNTNPDNFIQASVKLPTQFKGSAQPVFSERPKGMVYANRKLSGVIQPGDVHVYKISE